MKIAIDFDGVICRRTGIPRKNGISSEKPQKNAKKAIQWLISQGHEPYVFSNRNANEIYTWMRNRGFPSLYITDKKLKETKIYLDDRAVRFTSWQDFCKYLG